MRCDVADEQDRVTLVQTVRRELGPIDVLVNNAAAFGAVPLADMSLSRFKLCFEVNVFAPYRLMQLVTPEMIERDGARSSISPRMRPGARETVRSPMLAPAPPVMEAARRRWRC